jgi:hypothetical protein
MSENKVAANISGSEKYEVNLQFSLWHNEKEEPEYLSLYSDLATGTDWETK